MFPFGKSKEPSQPTPQPQDAAPAPAEPHPLDAMTGGAFSAATSSERAHRVQEWLASDPDPQDIQTVYRELSAKDKGAARALRDRLDALRQAKAQDELVAEWQEKAEALLNAERLNMADGLAWERDAAAAGAPLSREPLATLRRKLSARIQAVDDLQQRLLVQVEAAALLAQRIELLSADRWEAARDARAALQEDVEHWNTQAQALMNEPQWPNLDLRYPPQLQAAQTQLQSVWDAFVPALEQAVAAAADPSAELPAVPLWAEQLRAARAEPAASADEGKASAQDAARHTATQVVKAGVKLLEHAVAAGNTKDVNSAKQALRRTLKAHGQAIDDSLEARVHAALVSAGELQGWQRWSADKAREQLVARAEALLRQRPVEPAAAQIAPAPAPEKPEEAAAAPVGDAAQATDSVEQATDSAAQPGDSTPQDGDSSAAGADPQEAAVDPATVRADTQDATANPAATPAGESDEAANKDASAPVSDPAAKHTAAEDQAGGASDAVASSGDANAEASATASAATQPDAAAAKDDSAETASKDELMPIPPGYVWEPVITGRKLQQELRKLRDEWKTADAGGAPNQALWRRFDRACNTAHVFVVQWLEELRQQEEQNERLREALIQELRDWTARQAGRKEPNWKKVNRDLRKFAQRWRAAGHVSKKSYRNLQAQWKEALAAASAPLEQEQKASRARREDLIAQAEALGAEPPLRIGAVRALQASWQAEARAVPLPRRREQKLWEAFRRPIDAAFKRKDARREKREAAIQAHDEAVLAAAKVLEQASDSGDAARIREAMDQLRQATQAPLPDPAANQADAGADAAPGQGAAAASSQGAAAASSQDVNARAGASSGDADAATAPAPGATADGGADAAAAAASADAESRADSDASTPTDAHDSTPADTQNPATDPSAAPAEAQSDQASPAEPAEREPRPRPVVAVRGDDRPDVGRPRRRRDRNDERRGPRNDRSSRDRGGRDASRRNDPRRGDGRRRDDRRRDDRRRDDRPPMSRAVRDARQQAVENAQATLRELAARAHGEALVELLDAWRQNKPDQVPEAREFGRAVPPSARKDWQQAITAQNAKPAQTATALLRLEEAAEIPSPAAQLAARRQFKLQLLTQRDEPSPAETWLDDAQTVLGSTWDEGKSTRLQKALKVLLHKS